jgi:glycosyltransferase involved in cell wall biosynthesis
MENQVEINALCIPYVTNAFFIKLCEGIGQFVKSISYESKKMDDANAGLWNDPFPFNILHIHFPEAFYSWDQKDRRSYPNAQKSMGAFINRLKSLKESGVKIVWTVHNIGSHEAIYPDLDRDIQNALGELSDGIILQSSSAGGIFRKEFSGVSDEKIRTIPHINYIDAYPNEISRTDARKALGIDEDTFLFLCIGQIRPYKGFSILFDAFEEIKKANRNAKLVIAGKFSFDFGLFKKLSLRFKSFLSSGVILMPRFVPDDRLQIFLNASDICVFSYRDVFISGAVILAQSFGVPVIAPRTGCLPDYVDGGLGFLYEKNDPKDLADKMRMAMKANLSEMGKKAMEFQKKYETLSIARQTVDFYNDLLLDKPSTTR